MPKIEEIHEDIETFHDYGIHVPSRTLILDGMHEEDGDIAKGTADRFLKNLLVLEAVGYDPIKVFINCPGGCIVSGKAIYDAVKSSPCHMTATVLGEASSMASIILQAFDWRVSLPSSRFLLHDGAIDTNGNMRDVERDIEQARVYRFETYKILAEKTHRKPDYWARKLVVDTIFSADEALDEGLIDEICEKRT